MATATLSTATITPNIANADMDVVVDIVFDSVDQALNLPYRLVLNVVEDDVGEAPTPANPQIAGLPVTTMVQPNGSATTSEQFQESFALTDFNEDPIGQVDEVRIVVALIPQLPTPFRTASGTIPLGII